MLIRVLALPIRGSLTQFTCVFVRDNGLQECKGMDVLLLDVQALAA